MAARKICVVTGTRAEYGLLYWLIRQLHEDADVELQLVVTAMHLSPEFGYTVREIEADGFPIAAKVEMLLSGDSPAAIAKSIGLGTIGMADAFERLQPDLLVVLGDRFEILAAAQAAMAARVPIAHLHGGELTEGAIDDAIRHAITKMAHLHFVAAQPYAQRVVQLGEAQDRVFQVGALALDQAAHIEWLSRAELLASLDWNIADPFFLVTYHPVTLEGSPRGAMEELLAALDNFPNANILITYPNADTDGRILIEMIEAYADRHPDRVRCVASLGHRRYLSAMREAQVIIGNSSSGIIEAPALRRPTVNLGCRQDGRLKAGSVIEAAERRDEITAAIRNAIAPDFVAALRNVESLYGEPGAAAKIMAVIKAAPLEPLLRKTFHDL